MNGSPDISVVTSTKNRRALLCETMDSVAAQSLAAWEHIVVDDGSNDGTAEEVTRRAGADPRIRYVNRIGDKAGANVCRNVGIRAATADLIIFLDSDDLLRSKCLERRVETMRRNSTLDFAVFRAGVFQRSAGDLGRLYHPLDPGDDLLRFLSLECPWQTSGPVWRRRFIEEIGCFDETLLSMQDLEMHVRALVARGRYICLPDIDHDVRWQHDPDKTSVRHFHDPAYFRSADAVRAKLLETVTRSGLLTWTRQRALAGLCFGTAESWVRSRHLSSAIVVWTREYRNGLTSPALWLVGCLMLCALRLGRGETGLSFRLVNKWKGWVRFRQEPALLELPSKTHLASSNARHSKTAVL